MSIGLPIPGIQLFQNLTLKIQGQGHGWGQSLKSQHGSNIQSTHIPFLPCQSGIQFLSYDFSKIWPWKSRVKVMGEVKDESHNMGPTFNRLTSLSFHVDQASHSCVTTFSKFDLENKGSKVMGEVTVQSHNVGLTSYRLTSLSFYVKRASHSWVTTFLKIWPWKSRVKVMGEVTVQSHNVGLTSYRLTSLSFYVKRASHSWVTVFEIAWWTGARDQQKQRRSSKTPVYAGPKDQQLVLFSFLFSNSHCPNIVQNTFQSSKQFSDLNSHGSQV